MTDNTDTSKQEDALKDPEGKPETTSAQPKGNDGGDAPKEDSKRDAQVADPDDVGINVWLDQVTPSWFHPDFTMLLMFAFEVVMIILYFALVSYDDKDNTIAAQNLNRAFDSLYSFYTGIHLMVYIGFGYLMTFLRRNGFEALGYTLLLSSICFQWGILNIAFWERVHEGHFHDLHLNVLWLVEGDFSAATFLISFGVLLGKATKLQLFLVAIPEIMIYAFNFYLYSWVFEGIDMGGSVVIHLAGAVFGLGVSYTLFTGKEGNHKDNGSNYTSDRFSIIGTLILWLYWPSFNGAFAGDNQYRVAINTVLSLTGSAFGAFFASKQFRRSGKFEMVDIANATIAGGVAVGSSADLVIGPGAAILVGFIGGVVSCIGYIYLTPYLEKRFGLTDTCGVLNLHGTPGIIGSLAGMISAGAADSTLYGKEFSDVFPHGEDQWAYQLAGLFTTIGIMGLSGLIVGAVVKRLTTARPKDEMYGDSGSFEIETAEYQMINKWEEEEESLSHEQIAEA